MKTLIQKLDDSWALLLLVSAAVSALFLLFASVYTTPLNDYYGFDSAFYLLIGKGIRHGMLPYLDLYDQKGPLVFYINALGFLLTDNRVGVYLLQIPFMAVTVATLYRTFRLLTDSSRSLLLLLGFFMLYCGTAREEDLVEEWSLVFSAVPMYLGMRFLTGERPLREHPLGNSFVYGLCLGAHLMNRATNAALLCGLILAFAVLLAREREFAVLLCNAGMVLFGAAVFILPWCLFLRSIGALDEFFYAAFTHNFHYAANGTASKSAYSWFVVAAKTSMVPLSVVFAVLLLRKKLLPFRVVLPAICMGFIGAWTMTMGYGLKNYYLNIAPVLLLDVCLGMVLIRNSAMSPQRKKTWAILALCAVCFLPYVPEFVRHGGRIIYYDILGYPSSEGRKRTGKELSSLIPEDRDSVWGFDLDPRDYLYADLMPCYRYFAQQTWMSEAEPGILWEIDQMLASDPPVWVLVAKKSPEEFTDRLTGVFGYEFAAETSGGGTRVYHRPEE